MARRWNRRERLITAVEAGPVKLSLVLTVRDPVLIDGDQYELILSLDGVSQVLEVIIGRRAALERFEAAKPKVAVAIAKRALKL